MGHMCSELPAWSSTFVDHSIMSQRQEAGHPLEIFFEGYNCPLICRHVHPLTIQPCLLSFLALVHKPTYRFLCVLIQWNSQDPSGITHLTTTSIPFLFFLRLQILGFVTVFFKQNLFWLFPSDPISSSSPSCTFLISCRLCPPHPQFPEHLLFLTHAICLASHPVPIFTPSY